METKLEINNILGKNIKFLRKNTKVEEPYCKVRNMTQKSLASMIGSIMQQISKFEKSKNELGASQLYKISKVFGVSVDTLFDKELPNKVYSKTIKFDLYV